MAMTPAVATPVASANIHRTSRDQATAVMDRGDFLVMDDDTWYSVPNGDDVRLVVRRTVAAQNAAATLEVHRVGLDYDGIAIPNREYSNITAFAANTEANMLVLGPFPRQYYGNVLYFRNGDAAPAAANAMGILVLAT